MLEAVNFGQGSTQKSTSNSLGGKSTEVVEDASSVFEEVCEAKYGFFEDVVGYLKGNVEKKAESLKDSTEYLNENAEKKIKGATEVIEDISEYLKGNVEKKAESLKDVANKFKIPEEKVENLPDIFKNLIKNSDGEYLDVIYSSDDDADVSLENSDKLMPNSDIAEQYPQDTKELIPEEVREGINTTLRSTLEAIFGKTITDILMYDGSDIEVEPSY